MGLELDLNLGLCLGQDLGLWLWLRLGRLLCGGRGWSSGWCGHLDRHCCLDCCWH